MFIEILLLFIVFIIFGRFFIKNRYEYWSKLGVPYIQPRFPLGTISSFKDTTHSSIVIMRHYKNLKGKNSFGGLFFFITPIAFIVDIEMVKNILIKDFQFFMNRGTYYNEKVDPLSAHLFNLEGQKWKDMRTKLTPTFSSGKMKYMFPTIVNVAKELIKCINKEIDNNSEIEMKEIVSRFTTDVIGTCAFGIECNSLKNPNAIFRKMGKLIFEAPGTNRLQILLTLNYPNLARKLNFKINRDDVSDFFLNVVHETIEHREKNKITRNDFMDLLIQLKNKDDGKISIDQIAAQSFVFFVAGFETSSTAISFSLIELGANQMIQDRARNEIREVLEKYNGELTYEALMEMKYIDQILNETLRKYPPAASMFRKTSRDYTDPISGVILKKDMHVLIPIYAIQHDPDYYPNPDEYDPNRFSDAEVKKRNPLTFIPFGEGPRICIGLRFGFMQSKIGLVMLLNNFKFISNEKTSLPIKFRKKSFILDSESGFWLNIEKI